MVNAFNKQQSDRERERIGEDSNHYFKDEGGEEWPLEWRKGSHAMWFRDNLSWLAPDLERAMFWTKTQQTRRKLWKVSFSILDEEYKAAKLSKIPTWPTKIEKLTSLMQIRNLYPRSFAVFGLILTIKTNFSFNWNKLYCQILLRKTYLKLHKSGQSCVACSYATLLISLSWKCLNSWWDPTIWSIR